MLPLAFPVRVRIFLFHFELQGRHPDRSYRRFVALVPVLAAGAVERLLHIVGRQYAERHRHIPRQHHVRHPLRYALAHVIEMARLPLDNTTQCDHRIDIGIFGKELCAEGQLDRTRYA